MHKKERGFIWCDADNWQISFHTENHMGVWESQQEREEEIWERKQGAFKDSKWILTKRVSKLKDNQKQRVNSILWYNNY